ncbi:hypothetical protein LIER_25885 [Lithospermum erythrorhizon]|uniref:Uncharacterized protein n=1 Tax=Lithospermum erythrorhizon TaxID=34254 RepID=A0AAV3R9U3_LITER
MLCSSVKAYKKDFGDSDEAWILWTTEMINAVNPSVMGPEATYASQVADDYMEWFREYSHVRVSNPIHDGIGVPVPTIAAQPSHSSMAQVLLPLMVDVRNDAIAMPNHTREGLKNLYDLLFPHQD